MGLFYGDLFADWEIAVAKNLVSNFQKSCPWLKGFDFEDLLQECLVHWYLKRDRYMQERGASVRTFMAKVVKTRLQMILREQQADKRKAMYEATSLDESVGEDEIPLGEMLVNPESSTDYAVRLDIEAVLELLTPLQKDICRLLAQEYPVKQVAERLGKPRTTVRDEIKRIRQVFLQKGLKEHWK